MPNYPRKGELIDLKAASSRSDGCDSHPSGKGSHTGHVKMKLLSYPLINLTAPGSRTGTGNGSPLRAVSVARGCELGVVWAFQAMWWLKVGNGTVIYGYTSPAQRT